MELGSFVNINIFGKKYYYIQFVYILIFLNFLKKSTQMLRPQKGNSGVLSRNTLLNFGLCTNCPSTFYTLTFLRICFLTTSNALQIALMSSSFSGFLVITV